MPGSANGVVSWDKEPGLYREADVKHVKSYPNVQFQATAPQREDAVLPVLDKERDACFETLPKTDHILIAFQFEHFCRYKEGVRDGQDYRFQPLTELGLASLDMRDVMYGRGRGIAPGDRGSSWFRFMTPVHYVVKQYASHWGHLCQPDGLHAEPYLFAFGKSKMIHEGAIADRLQQLFMALRKKNRTLEEAQNNATRELVFLTFNSRLTEETFSRLGLHFLAEPDVRIWDLQSDLQLEIRFSWRHVRIEYAMEALGLRFEDSRWGNLANCTGNTAVFIIQILLALFYKSTEQNSAFASRQQMSWLRYTWVGHALDQTNIAPDDVARKREPGQMNRNEVPQRMDANVFY